MKNQYIQDMNIVKILSRFTFACMNVQKGCKHFHEILVMHSSVTHVFFLIIFQSLEYGSFPLMLFCNLIIVREGKSPGSYNCFLLWTHSLKPSSNLCLISRGRYNISRDSEIGITPFPGVSLVSYHCFLVLYYREN